MICKELFITSISMLGYVLGNIFSHREVSIKKFTFLFFLTWGILFAFDNVYSQECDWEIPERYLEDIFHERKLTQCQKDMYQQLSNELFRSGVLYMECAQRRSLLIPDDDLRDMAHAAIVTALTSVATKDIRTTTITAILSFVGTYLAGVWDSYQLLELEILRAQVYFDLSEFYAKLARCDGDILNGCQ